MGRGSRVVARRRRRNRARRELLKERVHDFPLPGSAEAVAAVPSPGSGVGWWAGSSHVALDEDGTYVIAYRVRTGARGRGSNVVARSEDGEHFTTVATIGQERFNAQSMEKPSLVRTDEGRWRLYVCPASPAPSKHWWIDVLEADDPADLATAEARTVFPGDESTGVKDPLVQRTPDGRAAYDGRATKQENWYERIGLAHLTGDRPGELEQTNDGAAVDARYLDVLPLPDGGYRIYYEARLPDESHELRTELIRP